VRYWLHCRRCQEVVPHGMAGDERWDWHVDCTVYDRPGRPSNTPKSLDFASHRKAYHPLKAVRRISDGQARTLLALGSVTTPLGPTEMLALEGRSQK